MKEIMIPYILIMLLLVKTGVIEWTLKNAVRIVAVGAFICFMLFTAHRYWSPADLTDSATIKAPHATLSPLIGEQIKEIFVTHNQVLKKGDLIYTLIDTESFATIQGIKADISKQEEVIEQNKRDIKRSVTAPGAFTVRQIEVLKSELKSTISSKLKLEADLEKAVFDQSRKEIRAPFDGQMSITNIALGSRIGNMHIYDTSKKFLVMRIPDQSYNYIKKGQFAEFFVNAYPGEIFRGRVHSIAAGTGEAMISSRSGDQQVSQHVAQNSPAHGRLVVIEFIEPEGYSIPIGTTGSAWISATKPVPILGFMDIVGAATVRLKAYKSYLSAM